MVLTPAYLSPVSSSITSSRFLSFSFSLSLSLSLQDAGAHAALPERDGAHNDGREHEAKAPTPPFLPGGAHPQTPEPAERGKVLY